jgi:hypothetical protein
VAKLDLQLSTASPWQITIREAMSFAVDACKDVSAGTCAHCWRHSEILPKEQDVITSAVKAPAAVQRAPAVDNLEEAWAIVLKAFQFEPPLSK